jgi:ribosomal protein L14E/L6E/L27E
MSWLSLYLLIPKKKKMKKFEELKALIASVEEDADKFYNKENSAAGVRIRKIMQDLKNLAQEIRTEVQDLKNKESK